MALGTGIRIYNGDQKRRIPFRKLHNMYNLNFTLPAHFKFL